MPNQMIALQARTPQTDILGGAIQRNAQMMNMMAQQQAAQRQAEQAQQKMQFDAAQEARAAQKAQDDRAIALYEFHRVNRAPIVQNQQGYASWLGALAKDAPEMAAAFQQNMPVENFEIGKFRLMLGKIDDVFKAQYGTAITRDLTTPEGDVYGANISSIPGGSFMTPVPDISKPLTGAASPPANAPATAASPTPAPSVNLPNDRAAILRNLGQPLPPAIMRQNGIRPMSETTAAPDIGAIVQNATQTGVVSQSDFDVLRQAAQGKEDQLAQIMKANNIRIMPNEDTGGFRSAVYRPDEAPAVAQEAQYDPNAYGRTRVKSPMQGPVPGSAIVPLPRVAGEAGATETGKGEAAANVELRKNLPKAQGALNLAVKQLDRDLGDIDYVLRTPQREMVVGAVEGRLPSVVNVFRKGGQEAQNVQSRIDKIKAQSVVTHLQQMRDASPQGSSLFGQVTEYEDRLVSALAGLDQAQDEATFDRALQSYRGVISDMREHLPRVFNDTYGRVGGKANVTAAPAGGKAGPTVQDIEYLKRNIRNPAVAKGFAQHFGMDAFNEAIGRR